MKIFAPARVWMRASLAMITLAAIAFFITEIRAAHSTNAIRWPRDIAWGWAGASVAIGVIHIASMGVIFKLLLGLRGSESAISIFLVSQMAKYIPGRIWGLWAQKSLIGDASTVPRLLSANVSLAAILLASQLALAMGSLLGRHSSPMLAPLVAGAVCGAAGVAASAFGWMHSRWNWRVCAPWAHPRAGRLTALASGLSLVLTASAWICLYWGALDYSISESSGWIAVSGASFVAGMFSILPGGLGLREAAFVALGTASPQVQASDAATLALLTRLWLLIVDGAALLTGFVGLTMAHMRVRR